MENKQEVMDKLLEALHVTRDGKDIESLTYNQADDKEERVTVTYRSGHSFRVNVNMDSGMAMIRDVMRFID